MSLLSFHWQDVLEEGRRERQFLESVIPLKYLLNDEVCVAGSRALQWWQAEMNAGPYWNRPGDIDIFVAGEPGKNGATFAEFLYDVRRNMGKKGFLCTSEWREGPYTDDCTDDSIHSEKLKILDVNVEGFKFKFSFVQRPRAKNNEEVVASFDMDICRVIYDLRRHSFQVKDEVQDHIRSGVAIVAADRLKDDSLDEGNGSEDPLDEENWKKRMTLKRMRKYQRRGFTIVKEDGKVLAKSTTGAGGS